MKRYRNIDHLQNECNVFVVVVFCSFRTQTGTERGTQWAEREQSRLTMSRKGKGSSQEENSVLCRKYQRDGTDPIRYQYRVRYLHYTAEAGSWNWLTQHVLSVEIFYSHNIRGRTATFVYVKPTEP